MSVLVSSEMTLKQKSIVSIAIVYLRAKFYLAPVMNDCVK